MQPWEGYNIQDPLEKEHLNIAHKNILSILESFDGQNPQKDITREDLETFPFNSWININPGVKVRRRQDLFDGILVFDTEMIQGSQFGMHLHSDCAEHVEVKEGLLQCLISKGKYEPGESMFVPAGQLHIPVALKFTVLRVYFK